MKNKFKKLVPYLLCYIFLFYMIPLPTLREISKDFAITVLLLVNPAVCLGISMVYGIKHGFQWRYLLLEPVLFIPSIFIFYNDSAMIYALFYAVFCIVGLGLGVLLKKKNEISTK